MNKQLKKKKKRKDIIIKDKVSLIMHKYWKSLMKDIKDKIFH